MDKITISVLNTCLLHFPTMLCFIKVSGAWLMDQSDLYKIILVMCFQKNKITANKNKPIIRNLGSQRQGRPSEPEGQTEDPETPGPNHWTTVSPQTVVAKSFQASLEEKAAGAVPPADHLVAVTERRAATSNKQKKTELLIDGGDRMSVFYTKMWFYDAAAVLKSPRRWTGSPDRDTDSDWDRLRAPNFGFYRFKAETSILVRLAAMLAALAFTSICPPIC